MERNNPSGRNADAWKQNKVIRFFEDLVDWKSEKKVSDLLKWLMYILILIIEAMLLVQLFSKQESLEKAGEFMPRLIALCSTAFTLSLCNALRLFAVKLPLSKIICFLLEMLASVAMIAVTGSSYLVFLYILILTGFYISSRKTINTLLVFICSIPAYLISYGMAMTWWHGGGEISYAFVISESVWALVSLVAHFILVNFALGFYRQYLRLDKAMTDLNQSRAELQKAYDSLAEATVLEERQRIAKEIHDTAGHSITTVIMQTEAAKLVVDENPEEAKRKLIAANLQAKHALEELRESVHLLSGNTVRGTLKSELEKVIEESVLGTGITIRWEIADLTVSAAKDRFICNALKECISNGIRHGGATAFWVELKEENGKAVLLVSDNGSGVKSEQFQMGFGLSAMAGQAERLGGFVQCSFEEDDGFEVVASLPIADV